MKLTISTYNPISVLFHLVYYIPRSFEQGLRENVTGTEDSTVGAGLGFGV